MARFIYTAEMVDFIRDAYMRVGVDDVTALFNAKFGLAKEPKHIKSAIKNHGIKCGRSTGDLNRGVRTAYTQEQIDWLAANYPSMDLQDLTDAFNAEFGTSKAVSVIHSTLKRERLYSGRDGRFEPGHVPHNKGVKGWQAGGRSVLTQFKKGAQAKNRRPVGSTRTDKDGYLLIKIAEPSQWRHAHLVVWESANGEVPAGQTVSFRDNNKLNLELSNLMLVSKAAGAVMVKMGIRSCEPELKDSAVMLAELRLKVREKTRVR